MTDLEKRVDDAGLRQQYLQALVRAVRPRAIREFGNECQPDWGRVLSAIVNPADFIWWAVTATEEERQAAAEEVLAAAKAA